MDYKSDEQLLIIKATIESNKQYYDEKMKNLTEDLTATTASMMDEIKFRNTHQKGSIHQRLWFLLLWSCITRGVHHWKANIIQKLLAYGLSNMRSSHQISINSSSRQNSKATLLWNWRTSTTTSICVSIWWLYSKKTSFLLTSTSKDTLSLKNTSSQIFITLPILGIHRHTLPFYTHCLWHWIITPV